MRRTFRETVMQSGGRETALLLESRRHGRLQEQFDRDEKVHPHIAAMDKLLDGEDAGVISPQDRYAGMKQLHQSLLAAAGIRTSEDVVDAPDVAKRGTKWGTTESYLSSSRKPRGRTGRKLTRRGLTEALKGFALLPSRG